MTSDIAIVLASLSSSLVVTTTAFAVLFRALRRNAEEIKEVHIIVNKQKSDMISYQGTLIAALKEQGIQVPINPNPHGD